MKPFTPALPVLLLAAAAGCGTNYITTDNKQDFAFQGRDWVTSATTDLENRGHTYKAASEKTWRAVHQVLAEMGVRVKDEDPDWKVIHNTYYATTPVGEVKAFINDINSRYDKFKVVKAHYRLTVTVNMVTRERTNVNCRVFWDVLKQGETQWESWVPNKRVIEYFFRRLDKRLPAFRDDSQHMWQGW
ncbi:MAG: hypothetical protein JW909_01130 [Planctomycetes bacterium]|nr:hypothetical protein [Planctomycetota bacterium]